MKKYYPFLSIFLINLVPIIGVLFLGWNVGQIILIFLLESFWIGLFNLIKMAISRDNSTESIFMKVISRLFLMGFFCFHYFFFLFILSIFVSTIVIHNGHLHISHINFFFINLVIGLGCTSNFITDFVLPKKYLSPPADLFLAPYRRVWILAALIFAGGFISHQGLGSQYFYLIILVLAKIVADIVSAYLFNWVKPYTKDSLE